MYAQQSLRDDLDEIFATRDRNNMMPWFQLHEDLLATLGLRRGVNDRQAIPHSGA